MDSARQWFLKYWGLRIAEDTRLLDKSGNLCNNLRVAGGLIDIPACKYNTELICGLPVFLWALWLS